MNTGLSDEARERAREIAEQAPPLTEEKRARLRAILRRHSSRSTTPST